MPIGVYRRNPRPIIFPVGPSIAYIPLTRGQFALIDSDKVENVMEFTWHANYSPSTKSYYARTSIYDPETKKVSALFLHRHLLNNPSFFCDHKNGFTLDNRCCNIRIANFHQNAVNRVFSQPNFSGFRGVRKSNSRWRAEIRLGSGSSKTHLGTFDTAEEASEAYQAAFKQYAKEFLRAD